MAKCAAVQRGMPNVSPAPGEMSTSERNDCKVFYRQQTKHTLKVEGTQTTVPIWIATEELDYGEGRRNVHDSWIRHIENAIMTINEAAPGLDLQIVDSENDPHKVKAFGIECDEVYTTGHIHQQKYTEIRYGHNHNWSDDWKQVTALHESLHALGFDHEHQRPDAKKRIRIVEEFDDSDQYKTDPEAKGITRFDPLSIMMYPEFEKFQRNESSDIIWRLKKRPTQNYQLSELDKVGLNYVYPPCTTGSYNPQKSDATGLYYCKRKCMNPTTYPRNKTDGICGLDIGPNCPACRTLKTRAVDDIVERGKWQGMSGLVYCGNHFGKKADNHDGYCGPDNGPQCDECFGIQYPRQ